VTDLERHSVAQVALVVMPRTRREKGTECTRVQGMARAMGAPPLRVFAHREEQPLGSTSVEGIVLKGHPSYGWARWGENTSLVVLASGLASASGTVDTLGHRNALDVREGESLDAVLILKWRTVLRGIVETPCE
jgi:hypothetical protein